MIGMMLVLLMAGPPTDPIVIGGPHGPMVIWRNPAATEVGEVGALYLNLSSNMAATPSGKGIVAQTTRVTNDAARNKSLWGHDTVVQMGGGTPFDASEGITLRVMEAEVGNVAGPGQFEDDPFQGRPGRVRSNAIEAVGIGGYPVNSRNTAGYTVWANSSDGSQWFRTGLALSSIDGVGVSFSKNPGGRQDQPRAFNRAAIEDASDSRTVLKVSGSHDSLIDLGSANYRQFIRGAPFDPTNFNIKNDANQQVNFILDSGDDRPQISYYSLADRGRLVWSFLKDTSNCIHIFQHKTGRSVVRVCEGAPTKVEFDGQVVIGGFKLYELDGELVAEAPNGRATTLARGQ